MYFGYESPTESYIMYATSADMNTWQVGDTVLKGSTITSNREFIVGGPRVIQLPSGQYRMFYRASQEYTTSPYYHIRSAISNDAKSFTKEGICIEINDYDANSFFRHVGHSEFFYDAGNNLRAFLTAKDTTMTTTQPDNIYFAESNDGGVSWSNFISQYPSCHDPVIIRDSSLNYHAYFSYLDTEFRTVSSSNGVSWPITMDNLFMIQSGDTITESSSPVKIADLGAGVNSIGEIHLLSNHASEPGPWTHVAYWTASTATNLLGREFNRSIDVFPNPTNGVINISNLPVTNGTVQVIDMLGRSILEHKLVTSFFLPEFISNGMYYLRAKDNNGRLLFDKKLLVDKK